MDAILQKMLAFEAQAGQIVQEAESRASVILEQARKSASQLEKSLEAELNAEVEALVRTRTAAEEKCCREELDVSHARIREENRILMNRVPGLAREIAKIFAYPLSSDAPGAPPVTKS